MVGKEDTGMSDRETNGIVIGLVTNLEDDQGIGRVKVSYPNMEDEESEWARLAAPMAGNRRGAFFRPEVGDEVLIAFEQGDIRRPYVVGSLWSKTDSPPPDDGNAKENNWRFIQSRSGHIILLDDTAGKERIVLVDKDGTRKVVIDSGNQKIQVICEQGDIEVKAAAGEVKIEALNVSVKASAELKLEATGNVTIKGAMVNIN
jgi:uncharacterized protein involved in type VI secretion and phage assembly